MKKLLLSLALGLGLVSGAQAQVEIGLKIQPSLGSNRFTEVKNVKLENDGARAHFGGGLVLDFFFGENYAFSSGLELVGRGGNVKQSFTFVDPLTGISVTSSSTTELGLQYLLLPVSLKLYTNEVAPDTRVYFQVGGEVGALIGAKVDGKKTDADGKKFSKSFNTPEAGALLGSGVELQMGKSTKVFGGISYHHGLLNIADDDGFGQGTDLKIFNRIFALDLGLKF